MCIYNLYILIQKLLWWKVKYKIVYGKYRQCTLMHLDTELNQIEGMVIVTEWNHETSVGSQLYYILFHDHLRHFNLK